MSITTIVKQLSNDFNNFFIYDFIIDKDDVNFIFNSNSIKKYSIKNPICKINIINLDYKKNTFVSSFTIVNKDMVPNFEGCEWEFLENIEVENCQILILNEDKLNDVNLDDWLENCITMKELYNVSEDGKICITSGFGPGIYRLNGQKNGDELIAINMEFIKEHV